MMQIMPADMSSRQNPVFESSLNTPSDTEDSFASLLQEMPQEEDVTPKCTAPYVKSSTDGVIYNLDEVCFTQNELQNLRKQLISAGAPEASLLDFDQLCDLPGGASLAQVQESLDTGSSNSSDTLTDEEREEVASFLHSIDESGALASQVLELMDNGKFLQAWQAIAKEAASSDNIAITEEQALLLAKGLHISSSGKNMIQQAFNGSGTLNLTGEGLVHLMQNASAELELTAAQQEKLKNAVDKTLMQLIGKARDRMKAEHEAAAASSRKNERSRIRIGQKLEDKARKELQDAVGKEEDFVPEPESDVTSEVRHFSFNGTNQQYNNGEKNSGNSSDSSFAGVRHGESSVSRHRSHHTMTDSRSSVDIAFASHSTSSAASVSSSGRMAGNASAAPYLSARAAEQVQNGLLTAMRDGSSRLTLQLNPENLGGISLILTSHNGEISAVIRPEKTETAALLQQQMDVIRTNLEEQGISIDSLEISQENSGNDANTAWQDVDQHNAWQEEDSRRQTDRRLRTLATFRNSRKNTDAADVAHSVHLQGHTARYAERTLDIVA